MYSVLLHDVMDLIKYNIISQILVDIIRLKLTIFFSAVIDIDPCFANIHVYFVGHYEKMQYWFQWICLVCMKFPNK
jgi:heat shock protein HspQ